MYIHVLDWRGDARPDMLYFLNVSGVIEPLTMSPTTLGLGATRGAGYRRQVADQRRKVVLLGRWTEAICLQDGSCLRLVC